MKRFVLFSALFLLGFINTFAQATVPTPPPVEKAKPNQARDLINPPVNPLFAPDNLALRMMILQVSVHPLYRSRPRKN